MTGFIIKLIAVLSMAVDHVGFAFELPTFTRVIGRLAFPLFAYLVAEGCTHTRNMNKYLRNLGIFAIISHAPFTWVLGLPLFPLYHTNIFFTLFLGVACCAAYKKIATLSANKILPLLPAIPLIYLGDVLRVDFGMVGVAVVFALFMAKEPIAKLAIILAAMYVLYWPHAWFFFGSVAALPILYFYNGKRGYEMKMAFYWFYPAHFALLGVMAWL
ncbi:MAG: conjugal transfer protein TraX [Defluviitaleaceae bacterium]|nr:conjugal transfer protein TraX [Defluviitaleaceae bacterium]